MGAMRVNDLIAAWMVGNGVLLLIAPSQRALLWRALLWLLRPD
jgi:hypothetical protein